MKQEVSVSKQSTTLTERLSPECLFVPSTNGVWYQLPRTVLVACVENLKTSLEMHF